jgi:hypothetical protein
MPQTTQLPCSAANSSGQGILIQIAYTDTSSSSSFANGNHSFVLAEDPATGSVYASRAGPANAPGPATISAFSGDYNSVFPDQGSVTAVQTVGYINASYGQVTNYMNVFAATTNSNNFLYLFPVQNSNSYTSSLVSGMGFTPPAPALPLVGYGRTLSNPTLQCAKP